MENVMIELNDQCQNLSLWGHTKLVAAEQATKLKTATVEGTKAAADWTTTKAVDAYGWTMTEGSNLIDATLAMF